MEDKAIIRLLFARAEEALTALVQKFGPGVTRLARNILPQIQDAEEAVNDTWLALWNAIPPAEPEPLAPYVYRVCRNRALKLRRHQTAGIRSAYEVSLEELENYLAGPSLEDRVLARELGRAMDRWLDTLTPENRVIFLRRYWFGDRIPDIAAHTGLRENTVSVRLNRLRQKLRDHLLKEELL